MPVLCDLFAPHHSYLTCSLPNWAHFYKQHLPQNIGSPRLHRVTTQKTTIQIHKYCHYLNFYHSRWSNPTCGIIPIKTVSHIKIYMKWRMVWMCLCSWYMTKLSLTIWLVSSASRYYVCILPGLCPHKKWIIHFWGGRHPLGVDFLTPTDGIIMRMLSSGGTYSLLQALNYWGGGGTNIIYFPKVLFFSRDAEKSAQRSDLESNSQVLRILDLNGEVGDCDYGDLFVGCLMTL